MKEIIIIHSTVDDVWNTLKTLEKDPTYRWVEGESPTDYAGWEEDFFDSDFEALGICVDAVSHSLTYRIAEFEELMENRNKLLIYIE